MDAVITKEPVIPKALRPGEWDRGIQNWERKNPNRVFPVDVILGLDSILAKVSWEHKHKQHSPVSLADLLAQRAFSACGLINEETQSSAPKSLSIDISGTNASLSVKKEQHKLAGAFPLLDSLEALKWILCWAGLIESDQDAMPYINFITVRVRREPSRASTVALNTSGDCFLSQEILFLRIVDMSSRLIRMVYSSPCWLKI